MTDETLDPFALGGYEAPTSASRQEDLFNSNSNSNIVTRTSLAPAPPPQTREQRLWILDEVVRSLWEKLNKEGIQFGLINNMTSDFFNIRHSYIDFIFDAIGDTDWVEMVAGKLFGEICGNNPERRFMFFQREVLPRGVEYAAHYTLGELSLRAVCYYYLPTDEFLVRISMQYAISMEKPLCQMDKARDGSDQIRRG